MKGDNAVKAVCPCGRKLLPKWVDGVTLRFQCRSHPERKAIIRYGDRVIVGRQVSFIRPHDAPEHPTVSPAPRYQPPPRPHDSPVLAICIVCGIRAKREDGGYHTRYWCPHHPGSPVFFVSVDQLEGVGWRGVQYAKAWTGNGWSRMKTIKGQVKPVAVGHV